jgi:hypothetical protein
MLRICIVSTRIRIRLFTSIRILIRIRIQGAKPMQIHADPDPGQTLLSRKRLGESVNFGQFPGS